MVEVPKELSRVRRRPRPSRELDQTARNARRKLEVELFRPQLRSLNLRLPPDLLQKIDDERRVPAFGPILSRCATIRMLLTEALVFRRAGRAPPRPGKVPYPIEVDWPKQTPSPSSYQPPV